MNQFKYLIYACLILFCILIGVGSISIFISSQDSSDSQIEPSVAVQEMRPSKGELLFRSNCASCHKIQGASPTAPALGGVLEKGPWADRRKLYSWVRNPAAFKDPYTDALKKQYGYIMTGFPNLTDEEIDAIVDVCSVPPAVMPSTAMK